MVGRFRAGMANGRSREIVRYLLDRGATQLELDELVAELHPERSRDDDAWRRAAVDLHHCQLPKLADARIIDYDARSNTLDYRPTARTSGVLRALVAA